MDELVHYDSFCESSFWPTEQPESFRIGILELVRSSRIKTKILLSDTRETFATRLPFAEMNPPFGLAKLYRMRYRLMSSQERHVSGNG